MGPFPLAVNLGCGPAAISYLRGTGETMIYGGCFIAALTTLVAVQSSTPLLLIVAAAAALTALYHRPMLGKQPALAFDTRGLFVQGIGVIEWHWVENINRADKPVRTLPNPYLIITLKAGWDAAPFPHAPSMLARWMRPAGRLKGNAVSIPLEGLKAEADPLTAAIEQHWRAA